MAKGAILPVYLSIQPCFIKLQRPGLSVKIIAAQTAGQLHKQACLLGIQAQWHLLQLDFHSGLGRASGNGRHLRRGSQKKFSGRTVQLLSDSVKQFFHGGHIQLHFPLHQFQPQPKLPQQIEPLCHALPRGPAAHHRRQRYHTGSH